MDFAHIDSESGAKFALLYPLKSQNRELKSLAVDNGAREMVEFKMVEGQPQWRLYEGRVPAGVDADAVFGSFASPEAKAASLAETQELQARKASAARAIDTAEIPEEKRYYPTLAMKQEFDQMRGAANAKFAYVAAAGAWVHKEGPTEGFEKFQTPEAKQQWQAEAKLSRYERDRIQRGASDAIDVSAEKVAGRHFVADNAQGFHVPSAKTLPALHDRQIAAMKAAPDNEIARVHSATRERLGTLLRKETSIRFTVASKENPELQAKDFAKLPEAEQKQLGKGAGLNDKEFFELVAIRRGHKMIRQEMIDRGLIADRAQAKGQDQGQAQGQVQEQAQEQLKPREQVKAEEKAPVVAESGEKNRARGGGAAMASIIARGLGR